MEVVSSVVVCRFAEAAALQTILAAQKSLACLLLLMGALLNNIGGLPDLTEKRFPIDDLHRLEKPGPENKDASDTEDDDEDEDDADEHDDDAGDEDFSAGEEGGDDEEGDPEDQPEANGNGGSDNDDDDDDGDDDEDEEDGNESGEEDEEDEEDQPPAKKRK